MTTMVTFRAVRVRMMESLALSRLSVSFVVGGSVHASVSTERRHRHQLFLVCFSFLAFLHSCSLFFTFVPSPSLDFLLFSLVFSPSFRFFPALLVRVSFSCSFVVWIRVCARLCVVFVFCFPFWIDMIDIEIERYRYVSICIYVCHFILFCFVCCWFSFFSCLRFGFVSSSIPMIRIWMLVFFIRLDFLESAVML